MPLRGSREAPVFDGSPKTLVRFFDSVEHLAQACQLSSEDTIQSAIRYSRDGDYELWNLLESSKGNDWTKFRAEVVNYYPGAVESKYRIFELKALANEWSKRGMSTYAEFGDFYRSFFKISTWLSTMGRLSAPEICSMFLQAFPPQLQKDINMRLERIHPLRLQDDPYTLEELRVASNLSILSALSNNATLSYAPTIELDSSPQFIKSDAFDTLMRSVLQKVTSISAAQPHRSSTTRRENQCSTAAHTLYRYTDCLFCSKSDHYHAHCPDANRYIRLRRCRRDARNRITLPNGTLVTSSVATGRNLMERIDNWHRANDPRLVSTRIAIQKPVAHVSPILATSHTSEPIPSCTLRTDVIKSANELESTEDLDESRTIRQVAHANIDQVQRYANIRAHTHIETTDYPIDESSSFILPRATPDSKLNSLPSFQPTKHKSTLSKDITSAAAIAKLVAHVVKTRENSHEEIDEDYIDTSNSFTTSSSAPNTEHPTVYDCHDSASTTKDENKRTNSAEVPVKSGRRKITTMIVESLRVVDVELNAALRVEGILDMGSEIVAISKSVWEKSGERLTTNDELAIKSANKIVASTLGVVNNLKIVVGGAVCYVQAYVVDNAPFELILGLPFLSVAEAATKYFSDGSSSLCISPPGISTPISLSTRARQPKAPNYGKQLQTQDHGFSRDVYQPDYSSFEYPAHESMKATEDKSIVSGLG